MLEQGENPKVVQEILGHSRNTHTMDTYSHVTPKCSAPPSAASENACKGGDIYA